MTGECPESEEVGGCTWPVGGFYPDTPPELCELDRAPDSEYCPRHTAADAAFEETAARIEEDMQSL